MDIMDYKILTYWFGGLLLIVCIAGAVGLLEINPNFRLKQTELTLNQSINQESIYNDCKNYTRIDNYMTCIESRIKTIFVYNITDDDLTLSYDELISKGGDCKNWAELWKYYADLQGLDSRYEILPVDEVSSHMILLASSKDGFCMVSNENVWCGVYDNNMLNQIGLVQEDEK